MADQPRGQPPRTTPPPVGRGRNALTALGGGVLVLAIAGGAWALFGRDSKKSTPAAIGPQVPTSAPANPVLGPAVPGAKPKPVTPTSIGPVAASKPAATVAPKPAPSKAAVVTPGPVATKAPTVPPAVSGPQQAGTVAQKAYTFKVARGDTLWKITKDGLAATGRSTSNADVAAYVQKVYAHNSGVVGSDPNLIQPGQAIVWPAGL
jgi:nucleoid-associated protein YgaU